MAAYGLLLTALLAALAGLAIGRAWERYRLQQGRWVDRRRARDTAHYILGLNHLVAGQVDLAIAALEQAGTLDTDALDIHLILGNLYREKGHIGKAVTLHQSLLQRARLPRAAQVHVLLALGLDYRRGGFVDRARDAFQDVLRLEPDNTAALRHLEKLHEEQHQWSEASDTQRRLTSLAADGDRTQDASVLAFLEHEVGLEAMRRGDQGEAARRFLLALDLEPRTVPAALHLGDLRLAQGRTTEALEIWQRLVTTVPERAYLAFDRLDALATLLGTPHLFTGLCERIIQETPGDWRARLALATRRGREGDHAAAIELLLEALVHHPHTLRIHQAIWEALSLLRYPTALVDRYRTLTAQAVFYLDPHVCMRCRYRSTELLWQCPHCHGWNTFAEERMASASRP